MTDTTSDLLEEAIVDPSTVFDSPADVVHAPGLEHADKVRILERWEADALQLMRATEENMSPEAGEDGSLLQRTHQAMKELGMA